MSCNKFWHVQSRVAETHLNHEKFLQKGVVNSSAHQEDGQHFKQHIDLSFVMLQIIKKTFLWPTTTYFAQLQKKIQ
jgi:hypothetical protein